MKDRTTWTMGFGTRLLMLPLLTVLLFTACQREPAVAPAALGAGLDDHGSGGHGADDPQGDDNSGDD